MKKITLFFAAAFTALSVSAERVDYQVDMKHKLDVQKIQTAPAKALNLNTFEGNVLPKQPATAAADTVFYLRPEGAFFAGMNSSGGQYYPRLLAPGMVDIEYVNASSNTSSAIWSVNATQVGTSIDYTSRYGFGGYYLPTLQGPNGGTYMYGEIHSDQAFLIASAPESWPMTTCAMYTSTTYSDDGNDCYMVGAGSYGDYAYGTGLTIQGMRLDTIGVLFDNLAVMYVDTVILPIYNNSSSATLIPSGAKVSLKAYAVNITDEGYELTNTLLGEATATASDISDHYVGSSYQIDMLTFVFKETNILGIASPKPISFDGPFYLELTGFNESACNFGILSDYYYPSGQTYFKANGALTPLWGGGGSNIAMSLNAIFPTLTPDTTNMVYTIPAEGGYAVDETSYSPGVYANFLPVDEVGAWTIDAPEWLSFIYNDEYFADYNYLTLGIQAEALPAGVTGRSAYITINCLGKKVSYSIRQGDTTGLNEIVAANRSKVNVSNGAFNLTYPADFTSVEVYNTSGQKVASYNLPSNGQFSINTNNMVNGVYMLRMLGATNEVIRAIK